MNSKPAASSQQPVARKSRIAFLLQAKRYKLQAGFTLIEMLVVIAVMAIVTGVMLANNGRFGGQVLLQNLAYDIALPLRQAQVYGISVQRFEGTDEYVAGYGVNFRSSSPDFFILYGDLDEDEVYSGTTENVRSALKLHSGYKIRELIAINSDAPSVPISATELDISFRRPEPDAYIRRNPSGDSALYDIACIGIESPRGDVRYVIAHLNGQISVQNTCISS